MRRVVARFYEMRSCRNLQKLGKRKKIKWLMEVCFAVRMRLIVAVDGDVMKRNWNAMTRKRRRLEGGEGRRWANWSGKKRAKKCGGADFMLCSDATW
jgi:hypothetical protein